MSEVTYGVHDFHDFKSLILLAVFLVGFEFAEKGKHVSGCIPDDPPKWQ
jgi:hypothetical protein